MSELGKLFLKNHIQKLKKNRKLNIKWQCEQKPTSEKRKLGLNKNNRLELWIGKTWSKKNKKLFQKIQKNSQNLTEIDPCDQKNQ